jgi:hypothetical protein
MISPFLENWHLHATPYHLQVDQSETGLGTSPNYSWEAIVLYQQVDQMLHVVLVCLPHVEMVREHNHPVAPPEPSMLTYLQEHKEGPSKGSHDPGMPALMGKRPRA